MREGGGSRVLSGRGPPTIGGDSLLRSVGPSQRRKACFPYSFTPVTISRKYLEKEGNRKA